MERRRGPSRSLNLGKAYAGNVRLEMRQQEELRNIHFQRHRTADEYSRLKFRLIEDIMDIRETAADENLGKQLKDRHENLTREVAANRVLRPMLFDSYYLRPGNKYAIRRAWNANPDAMSNSLISARHLLSTLTLEKRQKSKRRRAIQQQQQKEDKKPPQIQVDTTTDDTRTAALVHTAPEVESKPEAAVASDDLARSHTTLGGFDGLRKSSYLPYSRAVSKYLMDKATSRMREYFVKLDQAEKIQEAEPEEEEKPKEDVHPLMQRRKRLVIQSFP